MKFNWLLMISLLFACSAKPIVNGDSTTEREPDSAKQLLTFYCPSKGTAMEGGWANVMGGRIVTFEESGRSGHLPTIASWDNFMGCNNSATANPNQKRCVLVLTIPGLSKLPGYREHVRAFRNQFHEMCDTCETIVGVIEDTGPIFNRQSKDNPKRMFDLAVDDSDLCNGDVSFRRDRISWDANSVISGKIRPKLPPPPPKKAPAKRGSGKKNSKPRAVRKSLENSFNSEFKSDDVVAV